MKVRVAFGLAAAGLATATLYFFPVILDQILYGSLPYNCGGRLILQGSVAGGTTVAVRGRHCRTGTDYTQTESGYVTRFELARDGRFLAYGPGPGPHQARPRAPQTVSRVPVSIAVLRTPGEDGVWFCARGGHIEVRADGTNTATLQQVSALPLPARADTDFTIAPRNGAPYATLGLETPGPYNGLGCDPGYSHCELTFESGSGLLRVFLRSEPDPHGSRRVLGAVVIAENGRVPTSLRLSVWRPQPAALLRLTRHAREVAVSLPTMSEPVFCGPDARVSADSRLTVAWQEE